MKMNQQAKYFSKENLKAALKISFVVIVLAVISSIDLISEGKKLLSETASVAFAFLVMLAVPAFFVAKVQKKKLSLFGWKWPENTKKTILYTALVFLIMLPAVFVFGKDPFFQSFYILKGLSVENFALIAVILPFLYFFSEEFLFRGFFFFSLFKKIGPHAFWISSLVFAFLHITQPLPEIVFSFFAGILFCFLSYKTKSFFPSFAVHFLISVLTMGLIVFG